MLNIEIRKPRAFLSKMSRYYKIYFWGRGAMIHYVAGTRPFHVLGTWSTLGRR
jgi:hypothetical protein